MTLEAKTPASAWRASPGSDAPPSAPPSAAAVDDAVASRAPKRPRHRLPSVGTTPGAWWDLSTPLDGDDPRDDAPGHGASGRGRPFPSPSFAPFSAARGPSGRLAGNGATRCHVCGGEHERNRMVALPGCSHAFCAPCMEAWATRRARNCPLCKAPFEGWYHGERDESTGRWMRAFRALPDADAEPRRAARRGATRARDASRSARALAFGAAAAAEDRGGGEPEAGASAGAGGADAARGGGWKDAAAEEWRSSDEEAEEEEEGEDLDAVVEARRAGLFRTPLESEKREREARGRTGDENRTPNAASTP